MNHDTRASIIHNDQNYIGMQAAAAESGSARPVQLSLLAEQLKDYCSIADRTEEPDA
jgi:hypothetical protein